MVLRLTIRLLQLVERVEQEARLEQVEVVVLFLSSREVEVVVGDLLEGVQLVGELEESALQFVDNFSMIVTRAE